MATSEIVTIPARRGMAARVAAGQRIRIINTHGSQVVDTWAFAARDASEWMAMEASRASFMKLAGLGSSANAGAAVDESAVNKDEWVGNVANEVEPLIASLDVLKKVRLRSSLGHHRDQAEVTRIPQIGNIGDRAVRGCGTGGPLDLN